MIYGYLPPQMLGRPVDELTMEEFFRLYGMAESARDLRIQDIKLGVAQGIASILGQLES